MAEKKYIYIKELKIKVEVSEVVYKKMRHDFLKEKSEQHLTKNSLWWTVLR